jgi:hypothetical protein
MDHPNPYDAPQTIQPRSKAALWPWLLSWKGICVSGGSIAGVCLLARYLTVALRLHDPDNPWMVLGALANCLGITLGMLVFLIGSVIVLVRWLGRTA